MTESAGEIEDVHRSRRSQLGGGLRQRSIQVDQVTGNVVAAKQRGGQDPPSVEDVLGKFAAQHLVIGDPLAGFSSGNP